MKIDVRLDDCVAYGFTGGPAYLTEETPMDNGGDQRNGQWLWPKHRYSATYQNLRPAAQQIILAAFHVCVGRLHAFRFKDGNDYQVPDDAGIGTLTPVIGTTTPAQLYKTYAFGDQTKLRKITAPIDVTVYRNGSIPVTGTYSGETGLFTPSGNWAAGTYTWVGEFDVWVNFASDYNAFTINSWQAHTAEIELEENKGLSG